MCTRLLRVEVHTPGAKTILSIPAPGQRGTITRSLTLQQVEGMLDVFAAAEGAPGSIQFSGGEPSNHPRILEMLAAANAREIPLVKLDTNGIRLARDPHFAPGAGRARGPRLPPQPRVPHRSIGKDGSDDSPR